MSTATSEVRYSKFALFILFLLYASQGLPYGFQRMALPLMLRDRGVSLADIGFLGALSLPWMCKALWAPLVDRFFWPRLGRRKSWILPMQFLFIGAILMAATAGTASLAPLLASVLLMNLFAATQDIAVDGFAIDVLKPHALGLGNTVQVVGYKGGMVLAGGVLLSLSAAHGWGSLYAGMACIAALPLMFLPFFKEKPIPADARAGEGPGGESPTMKEILRKAFRMVTGRELRWAIALIMTGKLGEELAGSLYTTYLFDHGITRAQIGTWVGSYGMAASITGSALGGLLLMRWRPWTILGVAIALRLGPIAMQCWMTPEHLTPANVIAVTILEHVTGGMVTTAIFTYMMSLVEKRVGATEYTVLCSLEVLGKSPAAWCSGLIAERVGYQGLFFLGLALATAALIPWWKARHVVTH
ncbi:MAG TPA: MFS transporter [Candidatus Eisenbacteria bacterium]|jgi:MFS family permease|nr:MFS transporter [Candidatus Eisenbacteria bacterium]